MAPAPVAAGVNAGFIAPFACAQKPTCAARGDFDRDYFADIKRHASRVMPGRARIYAAEDYELESGAVAWLCENRGRDLDTVRRAAAERGDDGVLEYGDMHTEEELEEFDEILRVADPVSGRVWEDPMPEAEWEVPPDGERSGEWIGLRGGHRVSWAPSSATPHASEEEETAALELAFSDMQENERLQTAPYLSFNETLPTPSRQNFAKWQKAAEVRGGNATKYESEMLSPARKRQPHESDDGEEAHAELPSIPLQHRALADAHVGEWSGELHVLELGSRDGGNWRSGGGKALYSVRSCITERDDGILDWHTSVSSCLGNDVNQAALESSVLFASPKSQEALTPGRAVFEDGVFASQAFRDAEVARVNIPGISMSSTTLRELVGKENVEGAIELSMFAGSNDFRQRVRTILCVCDTSGKNANSYTHVLTFVEKLIGRVDVHRTMDSNWDAPVPVSDTRDGRRELIGEWAGVGVTLHPSYPPLAIVPATSYLSLEQVTKPILPDDVTWTENGRLDTPEKTSKRRERVLGKRKLSKRVSAARAHDEHRLAQCSLLMRERLGDMAELETSAWMEIPMIGLPSNLGFLSPRVGRFVEDYVSIALPGSVLLSFPAGAACPDIQSYITMTEMRAPHRHRLVAARSVEGELVGVASLVETRTSDRNPSDDVCAYI